MIRFPVLERFGVTACFSESRDGDCGLRGPEGRDAALCARRTVCEEAEVDAARLVCVRQVHGAAVFRATSDDAGHGAMSWESAPMEADAIVTDAVGLPIAVLVADCVPVYLVDPVRRAVGIVHAGWRGTMEDVVGAAVETMRKTWGADPDDLHALIGPSAGPCCYEVSEELAETFRQAGLEAHGRLVDLWTSNARRLEARGVRRIHTSGLCTICTNRFHSHRKGSLARNLAVVALKP